MALKFGSTTISSSYTPKFNGTALSAIKFGSTVVWNKLVLLFNGGLVSGYNWKVYQMAQVNSGSLEVWSDAADNYGYIETAAKVDLTKYSKLKATANFYGSAWNSGKNTLGITSTSVGSWVKKHDIYVSSSTWAKQNTFEVDISSLSGSYFIGLQAYCNPDGGGAGFTATKVWLE